MKYFCNFLIGIFIGCGAILPGVSSGVFCVIFGIYEDFMFYINEEFNPDRLNYAAGNYIYKTERGKRVLIDIHNSPYSMEIRVLGEE